MFFKTLVMLAMLGLTPTKEPVMHHITGTFEVSLKPEALSGVASESGIARMSIDKVFHGGIEGTSKGEMLSSGSPASGSAGYVALEKVTGTLNGAAGGFVLQHTATMSGGSFSLSISVVPDSGTEALKGIAGKFEIQIAKGKHSYTFDYSLSPG